MKTKLTPPCSGASMSAAPRRSQTAATTTILLLAFLFAPLFFTGCAELDKSGIYQGDQYAYQSELTIVTTYDLLQTFVKWEKENRAALQRWPEIKAGADEIRAGAPDWFKTAHAAHDAYKLNPSAPNKSKLELSLSILRTALAEATRYMTQATTP